MLAEYDKIAVRENSAVTMLHDWGLINCVGQVLDPTLLLDSEEWKRLLVNETDSRKYEGPQIRNL